MRLNGFDLNQLVCLQALLAERSVTRAAARVRLSQSAMSTVLASLRQHFDDELLSRSGRSLELTPFAETLITPLAELMNKAQSFAACAPSERPLERELRIVASDYAVSTFLADALRAANMAMPSIRFNLIPLSGSSAQGLKSGEVDLLFAGEAMDVGVAPTETLYEDRFVCVQCRHSNPRRNALTQAQYLAREHVVVRYFEHQMPFVDEDVLRRAGQSRYRRITAWSFAMVPSLICQTTLLATVPSRIAKDMQKRWPIDIVPFPFEHLPVRLYVYRQPSRDDDSALNEFMLMVRRASPAS